MTKKSKITLASRQNCTGCAACASICPTNSIIMSEDKEGFLQPHIDTKTCVSCHKCEKTCPIISPIEILTNFETQAFAAINKDETIRMRSSSGGIFHALAKWTIEQRGVVFGARFNDCWEVVHGYTETIEGLEPFMRSKYVQSCIGNTYKQTMQFLQEGRHVLYTGTPCQIVGLKAYLGNKHYDNLVAVDIICHGVPSPKVWKKYLRDSIVGDKVVDINFRDKSDGWKDFRCVITTDTSTRSERMRENMFVRGFLDNVYLRRSCYVCQFKKLHRVSDMTIGDFWGVQNICPEMDDNKGTSAVLVHTEKGLSLLEQISAEVSVLSQNVSDVVSGNIMMIESAHKTSKRNRFFMYSLWLPFNRLGFTINKDWCYKRVARFMKKHVAKISRYVKRRN